MGMTLRDKLQARVVELFERKKVLPALKPPDKVVFLGSNDPDVRTRETFHNLPPKTDINSEAEGLLKKVVVSGDNRFEVMLINDEDIDWEMIDSIFDASRLTDEEKKDREMIDSRWFYGDVSAVFIFAKNVLEVKKYSEYVASVMPTTIKINFVQARKDLAPSIQDLLTQKNISKFDASSIFVEGVSSMDQKKVLFEMLEEGVPREEAPAAKADTFSHK